jgi:hypothetical protein
MKSNFDHLNSYAMGLVNAAPETRVRSILQPRLIEHPAVRRIREWVDRNIAGPRSVRPPCLMISADAGGGKTSTLLHLQRCHPDHTTPGGNKTIRPIIQCDIEPNPEIPSLQQTLLTRLGSPLLELRSKALRNDLIGRYLAELDTQVILFDEFQHILHLSPRWQRVVVDWVKWISTSAHVHIICAGARGVERLVQHDSQLSSRFPVTELPKWVVGKTFGSFLQAYERSLPLLRPSRLWELSMQKAMLEESRGLNTAAGITDAVVRIIREAAIAAVSSGREQITRDLLEAWRNPVPLPGAAEPDVTAQVFMEPHESDQQQLALVFQDSRTERHWPN